MGDPFVRDWTLDWNFHPPLSVDKPGATLFIGTLSVVHSLCHLPHLLLYRRLGLFTAFWSAVGVGLIFGAIMEEELLYDVWIWYSCVYVPVMLITMYVVLTAAVWALDIHPLRAIFALVAILYYLFMFYCIVYVMSEKRKIFTTTTIATPNTTMFICPKCPMCTTPVSCLWTSYRHSKRAHDSHEHATGEQNGEYKSEANSHSFYTFFMATVNVLKYLGSLIRSNIGWSPYIS